MNICFIKAAPCKSITLKFHFAALRCTTKVFRIIATVLQPNVVDRNCRRKFTVTCLTRNIYPLISRICLK